MKLVIDVSRYDNFSAYQYDLLSTEIDGVIVRTGFGYSDVDVLVVFDSNENIDLFDIYFELKEQLEKVFGRQVDLVVDKPFRNSVFRESVEKTRTVIYER